MLVVELELSDGTELEVAREDPDPDDETGLLRDELENVPEVEEVKENEGRRYSRPSCYWDRFETFRV